MAMLSSRTLFKLVVWGFSKRFSPIWAICEGEGKSEKEKEGGGLGDGMGRVGEKRGEGKEGRREEKDKKKATIWRQIFKTDKFRSFRSGILEHEN